jgi:hypothetical protein
MNLKDHRHGIDPGWKRCSHPLCRARRSSAQAALRERRIAELRYWDVRQERYITDGAPHGTEGGATNWRCDCAVVPGTEDWTHPQPGCRPVANAAANARWHRASCDGSDTPACGDLPIPPRRRHPMTDTVATLILIGIVLSVALSAASLGLNLHTHSQLQQATASAAITPASRLAYGAPSPAAPATVSGPPLPEAPAALPVHRPAPRPRPVGLDPAAIAAAETGARPTPPPPRPRPAPAPHHPPALPPTPPTAARRTAAGPGRHSSTVETHGALAAVAAHAQAVADLGAHPVTEAAEPPDDMPGLAYLAGQPDVGRHAPEHRGRLVGSV